MHPTKSSKKSGTGSKPPTPRRDHVQGLDRSSRKDTSSLRTSLHMKRVLSGKISRRSITGFINKSVRNASQMRLGHRPKRNAIHRTWDYTAGLSWKEEKELKKALMASLHESKKPIKNENNDQNSIDGATSSTMHNTTHNKKKVGRKPKSLKLQMPQPHSVGSNGAENLNKNFPVRAQRKFAQGSRPCSPGCSPVKSKSLNSKLLITKKAKTEDFLTFLCLRGTTSLPPHLDFSNNFLENDTMSSFPNTPRHSQDGSRPNTPSTNNGSQINGQKRPGERSRSESPDVEITLESHELGVKPLPLETPENSPIKGMTDSTTQMEADTTVSDDHTEQSGDIIILDTSESPGKSNKNLSHKRLSLSKQNRSKSADPSSVKRKVLKSPNKSPSPVKKALKTLSEKRHGRILRSLSLTRETSETIDLTENEESNEKEKATSRSKTTRKRTLSGDDSTSPRTRSRTESESGSVRDSKGSPVSRQKSGRKSSVTSLDRSSEGSVTRRGHLRSSSRGIADVASTSEVTRSSSSRKETESMTRQSRSRSGPVPKAAVPAGFPKSNDPGRLSEVPTYHPSAEQFQDPISYLHSIWRDAEAYGMCRIVPPEGWKPECEINEDLRFTTQVQYIHKMADRWGSAAKQLECIKQHLKSQGITLEQSPCVGGVELDLPAVSAAIQAQGGLQSVINKNKWQKVLDNLQTPKTGQERISRLYEIYCKYLLSYDTLSADEKHRLEQEVDAKYHKGSSHLDNSCSSKGRSKPLSEFFRVSRNTQSMWFNEDEPATEQVEDLYWQLVSERKQHVSVQVAHIDTKHCGSAFPAKKDSPYVKHGWNYNTLQHHQSSVLRHLGQVTGLTVPMLHIGMVFSTSCWARDPHFLPYIVYSHTGADVVWYCIPSSQENNFKQGLEKHAPKLIDAQSPIWLPEDSVMMDPNKLLEHNVSHCRTVQHQGEFIVVFPKAFTASITCGYNISESLHFATSSWLPHGSEAAKQLYASGEPDLFSMEKLLVLLAEDEKTPNETLQILLPLLEKSINDELDLRKRLGEAGLQQAKRVPRDDPFLTSQERPRRTVDFSAQEENRCDSSSKICYYSTVMNEADNVIFALPDALQHIRRKKNLRNCKLLFRYDQKELKELVQKVKDRISTSRSPNRKKTNKTK